MCTGKNLEARQVHQQDSLQVNLRDNLKMATLPNSRAKQDMPPKGGFPGVSYMQLCVVIGIGCYSPSRQKRNRSNGLFPRINRIPFEHFLNL
jgi:hypothetical protein